MKLGLLVEGDWHRAIVGAIARRALPEDVHVHVVRMGGSAAFATAYTTAIDLIDKGYDHVVCVFDTEVAEPGAIAARRQRVAGPLAERGLSEQVSVCPAVPYAEAWLLAGLGVQPLATVAPREQVRARLGVPRLTTADVEAAASSMDLAAAQAANASLADFVRVIRDAAARRPVVVDH